MASRSAAIAADPLVGQLWSVPDGSQVREDQMKALFGEGLHPNADQITRHLTGVGVAKAGALAAARLGRPFRVNAEENEWTRRLRAAYGDYNTTIGAERSAPIADDIRARIRTAVSREMFTENYGRPPADDRELSGFVARQSRVQTTAVAGYDLTFTPVKSVSVLWALAPRSMSRVIEECHHQAVAEAITFLEEHAAFSRMGADGIAQVNTTGLIAAAFDHRDSRAGDPNLHTHVAVSNKVQATGADGIPRWLALDGTPLHKAAVAASELYNTRSEALLIERVGVAFADAADTAPGKRPVREIVGVPTELTELWSSRRAAIEHRVGQLAKAFQTEHGREPTVVEMLAISQQATLETRQAKHEPRSLAEQRHTWRTQAVEVVGSQRKLSKLIADITGQTTGRRRTAITGKWVREQAATVLANVAETRSTWQVNHIRAEAQRLLRYLDHPGGPEVVNRIVTTALGEHSIALTTHADTEMGEPVALRRRDGESVYTGHDTTVYTSAQVMAAERRILAAAAKGGGRVVDDTSIGLALLEAHAQHGFELNDGQQQLVKTMATSGARLQLALAPAGTGKTTAMGALAAAWANSGGNVIGLAPTASAAEVLAEDTGVTTDTMAKFVQLAEPADRRCGPPPAPDDPARKWFKTIGSNTLLIVDEAGKASTFDLDAVIGYALARGASVRLVGDDQQLASISASGVISDIAARHETLTLSTVVRFADPGESAASLAMREGDPAGIAYYIDHRRVHVGADQNAADMAYAAWAADIAAGRDSILLAPTNEQVAELNERARLDRLTNGARLRLGHRHPRRRADRLGRRLDRHPQKRPLAAPQSQQRMGEKRAPLGHPSRTPRRLGDSVTAARARQRQDRAPARRLHRRPHHPGVCQHHRQRPRCDRRRARHRRHLPHRRLRSAHPPAALRCGHPRQKRKPHLLFHRRSRPSPRPGAQSHPSPHRRRHPLGDPAPRRRPGVRPQRRGRRIRSVHPAARRGRDVLRRAHRSRRTHRRRRPPWPTSTPPPSRSAPTSPTTAPGRCCGATWPCWPSTATTRSRPYTTPPPPPWETPSTSPRCSTGGCRHRKGRPPSGSVRCAGWRPSPTRWPHHPQWGPYLHARSQLVGDLADQIRAAARQWQPGTVPAWARPLLAEQPQLMAEIAVFRAAHDVDVADTRITGPEQHANRSAAIQQFIHGRVDTALRRGEPGAQRWRSLAEGIDAHISADPFWPRLATHLDAAARAGADVVRTAHRRGRPPRAAARRAARRGTVVAAGRHPGTAHPRRRQHRAAPGLDTRTAPPARLAHRRNRHRRPGVAIAGHRRRRLRMGTARPAHRRRRTPARHRRNRAPAARRIRPPADLPRRTAHPPRRHHRRRHPPPRRGRRAVRPRRARRAARPVQRRRSAARPSTTTPTATPKTPSTGWTSPTCPVTARAPRHRGSTPTLPRCAPSARPPTNTLPTWPRRSCASKAPPKSRPPASSPNYTNATSSSVTTSMTSPTPTATGSAPNTPPKYTVRYWISSPPRSAPPTTPVMPTWPPPISPTATS